MPAAVPHYTVTPKTSYRAMEVQLVAGKNSRKALQTLGNSIEPYSTSLENKIFIIQIIISFSDLIFIGNQLNPLTAYYNGILLQAINSHTAFYKQKN